MSSFQKERNSGGAGKLGLILKHYIAHFDL